MWPTDAESLTRRQLELAGKSPDPWRLPETAVRVGGCWVCFPRGLTGPGSTGDPCWSAAVVMRDRRVVDRYVGKGAAGAPYVPGLLALRIGALLEAAVRGLREPPDVLLVDATGRDHPRGAGLALHLGAELGVPTVGVTHRPLRAEGEFAGPERGAMSPLRVEGVHVGCWLRTRQGTRPLVVHPGWCVDLPTAVEVVLHTTGRHRTPEPLRRARRLAREARAGDAQRPLGKQ
jgi:deoxyribonuclease V